MTAALIAFAIWAHGPDLPSLPHEVFASIPGHAVKGLIGVGLFLLTALAWLRISRLLRVPSDRKS